MNAAPVDINVPVQPDTPIVVTGSEPSTGRSRGKTALRIAITLAILALLFYQVSWIEVWRAVRGLQPGILLLVCLLWIPTQFFQYLRWWYLARQAGPGVSSQDIRRGYWVGYTLGLITPGRVGTYGRALALKNCSLARAAGLTIIERNYSAFVLNGLGLMTLVLLPLLGWESPILIPAGILSGILIAAGCTYLLIGIYPKALARPVRKIVRRLPLGEKLGRAMLAIEEITPSQGILLIFLALLGLSSALLQFVLLIYAMGAEIPLFAGMLAVLLNFFLKGNIPISIGNLGVGEWTAMFCLEGLGVEASVAVAASLLLFFINVFIPGLIGLPYVSSLRVPPNLKGRSTK